MDQNTENQGIEFQNRTLTGDNGNTFDGYYTEYMHTYDDGYGNTETYPIQMLVNKETGASITGYPGNQYILCIQNEDGVVQQYSIVDNKRKNATTETVLDINELAYLLDSNFVNTKEGNIHTYGPNGELAPMMTADVHGEIKPIIIEGNTVPLAVMNPESIYNYTTEFDSNTSYNAKEAPSTGTAADSTQTDTSTHYELSSYSGVFGSGEFQQGLEGNAQNYFDFIRTDLADRLCELFTLDTTFSGQRTFEGFNSDIDMIMDACNNYLNSIISENVDGAPAERAARLREVQNLVEEFQMAKSKIDPEIFRQDIRTYNDNVEKVKVENTRKELRDACKQYNAEKHILYYNKVYDGVDAAGNPTYRDEPVYDKIEYDAFIGFIDSFLDMKTDQMVIELERRNVHVSLPSRPDWSY